MKVNLQPKTTVKGYSPLFGIDYTRMKARMKNPRTSPSTKLTEEILRTNREYFSEYRLVKEPEGYIFREVLTDSGINGHHKTVKQAIVSAIWHIDIYLDEPFQYQHTADFQKVYRFHKARMKGCKHQHKAERHGVLVCDDCDKTLYTNQD